MKKMIVLVLLLITLFTITKKAHATTTFYLGTIVGGKEQVSDYNHYYFYSGDYSTNELDLTTYNKGLKLSLGYQLGECKDYFGKKLTTSQLDGQIGFPVINQKQWLLYVTAGLYNYTWKDPNIKQETNGVMIGGNALFTTEKFQIEGDIQYSGPGASNKFYSPTDFSSLELTVVKLQTQYNFKENLGLVLSYRLMHFNVNDSLYIEDIATPSIGLIYRF